MNDEAIKLQEKIGPIVIDNQSVCLKCHRNIGDSIFVRESEHGQLLHLHCAELLGLAVE